MSSAALKWIADSFRFAGAMFYWNIRKSAYLARGRKGRCPCQNESDDSVPGRVRCDAVLHWHQPARFRRICPLLVSTPEGWRCSVHASAVRPFWGRVVAWTAVGVVGLYLLGALAVFGALRLTSGLPVRYGQIAWPGRWHEIRGVQSQHLFTRAIEAFARGRMAEAYLALTTAVQRDPDNYPAALMLAQITMFQGSFLAADRQFEALRQRHPTEIARTNIAYHDTLLGMDRMAPLATFSLQMGERDSGQQTIWLRSALLAARGLRPAEVLQFAGLAAQVLPTLPPAAQFLIKAELDLHLDGPARVRARLAKPLTPLPHPFYAAYQIERLVELGAVPEAQTLLDSYASRFGRFDRPLLQYIISRAGKDRPFALLSLQTALKQPLNEQQVERIAGILIRHPDADAYRALAARVRQEEALQAVVPAAGLWVCGVVCDAPSEAAYWQLHGVQPRAAPYPRIEKVDFSSRSLVDESSPVRLVNTLGLPREVIMALYSRMEPPRETAGGRGK